MASVTTAPRAGVPARFSRGTGGREPLIAMAAGVVVWYLVGLFTARLPMPHEIVAEAAALLADASSYPEFGATLRRMAVGLAGGFLLGATVGIAMGARPLLDGGLRPWVVLLLAIPEPVVIISCVLILGISETSLMIALILSLAPYIAVVTNAGMKAIDLRLVEMSEVFRAGWRQTWTHVIIPQTVPALFAGLRTGFALSWKLVVVLEAVAASTGVGAAMTFSFRQLEPAQMVAWGLILALVMWLVEVQGFRRVERRLSRWRG
jgi:NitT/TauT family transport system permease protein